MSVRIIDSEDLGLCFRPRNGTAFPCFYVAVDCGDLEFRILVSAQPDRTAHVMKLDPMALSVGRAGVDRPEADRAEVHSGLNSIRDAWVSLLRVAVRALPSELVLAVYVLDDGADPEWSMALSLEDWAADGTVHHYRRRRDAQSTVRQPRDDLIRIQRIDASRMVDPDDGAGQPDAVFTAAVISLLDDTIQTSEDCLLRTKLQASDILALFAYNPNNLQMLFAFQGDVLAGILVGDSSPGANQGHIEYLGVHCEARRQSVATRLVGEFQLLNANSALGVAVHERNFPSILFFQKLNFVGSEQYQLWTRDI